MSTTCVGLASRATCAGEHAAGRECLGQIRIQGVQLVVSRLGGFEAENSTFFSVIGRGLWWRWILSDAGTSVLPFLVFVTTVLAVSMLECGLRTAFIFDRLPRGGALEACCWHGTGGAVKDGQVQRTEQQDMSWECHRCTRAKRSRAFAVLSYLHCLRLFRPDGGCNTGADAAKLKVGSEAIPIHGQAVLAPDSKDPGDGRDTLEVGLSVALLTNARSQGVLYSAQNQS